MRWPKFIHPTVAVLGFAWALGAPQLALAQDPVPEFKKAVRIVFPEGGYAYTLAEAARGVKIEYTIVVEGDREGVSPRPFGPSFLEPPGPSGLRPRERLSGNGQNYCLEDFGLAAPPREEDHPFKTLKKGTYRHAFEWDGRNWSGPSDTQNPKGKPFPAGTYDVTVLLHGTLATDKGPVPYEITGKTKIVLK
jgi:hypothetical protein